MDADDGGTGSEPNSGSSAGGDDEDDGLDPAKEFLDLLTDEYLVEAMSAHLYCMLCYWAHRGGMADSVGRLG